MCSASKSCCWPILVLLLTMVSGISPVPTVGEDVPPTEEPSLSCGVSIHDSIDTEVILTCTIQNPCTTDIFVLTSPLTLEGPRSDQPLPRRHTSGDRYENVFEYDRGVGNLQEEGVLFDPWVIPTPEEISAMLKVAGGQTASLSVNWKPGSALFKASPEMWWIIRIKLIYLSESRLNSLRNDDQLRAACPGRPLKEIETTLRTWSSTVPFKTREWREGRGYESGLCDDALSLIFEHLYSNQMTFNLNGESRG